MMKILPRRATDLVVTEPAGLAPAADRPVARFVDGHAGGMPAPRRQPEPGTDAGPGPISSRYRPS